MTPEEYRQRLAETMIACRAFKWWAPEAFLLDGWHEMDRRELKALLEDAEEALHVAADKLRHAKARFDAIENDVGR